MRMSSRIANSAVGCPWRTRVAAQVRNCRRISGTEAAGWNPGPFHGSAQSAHCDPVGGRIIPSADVTNRCTTWWAGRDGRQEVRTVVATAAVPSREALNHRPSAGRQFVSRGVRPHGCRRTTHKNAQGVHRESPRVSKSVAGVLGPARNERFQMADGDEPTWGDNYASQATGSRGGGPPGPVPPNQQSMPVTAGVSRLPGAVGGQSHADYHRKAAPLSAKVNQIACRPRGVPGPTPLWSVMESANSYPRQKSSRVGRAAVVLGVWVPGSRDSFVIRLMGGVFGELLPQPWFSSNFGSLSDTFVFRHLPDWWGLSVLLFALISLDVLLDRGFSRWADIRISLLRARYSLGTPVSTGVRNLSDRCGRRGWSTFHNTLGTDRHQSLAHLLPDLIRNPSGFGSPRSMWQQSRFLSTWGADRGIQKLSQP